MVNERKLNNIQINTPCGGRKTKKAAEKSAAFLYSRREYKS